MTLTLFFLFALGLLCAWLLLKAVNWLPLVLVSLAWCSCALANWTATVNSGTALGAGSSSYIYVNGIIQKTYIASGGETTFTVTVSDGYPAGTAAFAQCPCGSSSTGTRPADGGSASFSVCGYTPINTYYFNYCITNDTGLPMTVKWLSSCTNFGPVNLGLGQPWCISFSTTNNCTGGFVMSNTGPDGSLTNVTLWPPTGPNGTNSPPGSPNGGNTQGPGNLGPGGGGGTGPGDTSPGPGAGVPGGTNALNSNQYYQGVTNLQNAFQYGFGYMGNVIASGFLNESNQLQLEIVDWNTNLSRQLVTTNLETQQTNLLTQITNALANLNTNVSGLNTNGNGMNSNQWWQAMLNFGTNYAYGGVTNAYGSNGDYMGVSMSNSWGNPYGGIASGATNVAAGSNSSYWFIPMKTNPLTAFDPSHPPNDPNSGIDLDPRHNSWFLNITPFMRNAEVWLITLFVLWQIRAWMSERLLGALRTPAQNVTLDAASVTQAVVKTATTAALLVGMPAAMAAVAYNFGNWFGYTAALDPLGSAIQTVCGGTVGPMIADGIGIVSYMFPITFAGGAIIYLGAVWIALDVLTAAVMFKLRSPL